MSNLTHPLEQLTDREQVVLQLIADGLTNRQIGERLSLTLHTVKWYVKQIFAKLHVSRRTQAVAVARSLGLLDAPQTTAPQLRDNLPVAVNPFLGREKELVTLARLLNNPDTRLVTVVGLGGNGKSRLALEAVTRYQQLTTHETYFIPLEGARTRGALVRTIASVIGHQLGGQLEPEEQLIGGLRRRSLLLLLDSFGHLLDSADLISRILAASAGVRLLMTSRERLNLQGETLLSLQGLDYEAEDASSPSSAAQLFIQSARRLRLAFQPTSTDSIHIEQICRLAEGMPLAIQLAAAWMGVLTPERILVEMEGSLAILSSRLRDLPDRHLSVRAVFAHSWRMLSQDERTTLKKLSVFEGGFDRAAAEQVAGTTIFLLSGLVDKSLVTRLGPNRYKLHGLLRQFAAERLAVNPDEQQQVLNQHSHYYAALLHQFEIESKTNFDSTSISLLRTQIDLDNVLSAWRHARKATLIAEIGKLAYFLSLFYEFFGLNREGQETFDDALQHLREQPEQASPTTLMRVLTHYGWFCQSIYEFAHARLALEEALACSSKLNDSHIADVSLVYGFLGWVTHLQSQASRARKLVELGLELSQEADFQLGQVVLIHILGEIEYDAGNYSLARSYHQQTLTQYESGQFHTLLTLGLLSISCSALEDYSEALDHLREMTRMLRSFPNTLSGLLALIAIATLRGRQGHTEPAVVCIALALNHPQIGSFARHKAETMLKEFQPMVAEDAFDDIMGKAAEGRLPNSLLESDFRINAESIDRLEALLETAIQN